MSNVFPIWTPKDSVDTAQAFHAELGNAERGVDEWFVSQSRNRRGRIMDAVAVILLLMLAAAFGVCAVLVAAPAAKAAPASDAVIDYALTYGEGAVCPVLDSHRTVSGVLGVLLAIKEDGFTDFEAGQIVGLSVNEFCPRNAPLLRQFVATYTPTTVA